MGEGILEAGVRLTALYTALSVIKKLLPPGSMGKSANKAVDIAGLVSVIRIIWSMFGHG